MQKDNTEDNIVEEIRKSKDIKAAQNYLTSCLNSAQAEKLNSILSDDKALSDLLNTPQARRLMKKLTEENDE